MAERDANAAAVCSVIVPAYNVERWVGQTIASVIAQSEPRWELIVVDDGSTDSTADRVRELTDARIRLLRQENRGASSARNRGLIEANAPFVVFLDADDVLAKDALARLLNAFERRDDCVAAYGEAVAIDEAGDRLGSERLPYFNKRPSGDVLAELASRNFVVSPGVLCVRRSALDRVSGFREDLSVSEDWELWCRLAAVGEFTYVGGPPVLQYRLRAQSVARSVGIEPVETLACIDAIYSNEAVARALGARMDACKRRAIASAYSFVANQRLRERDWASARRSLWQSLRSYPWQPREWVLLAASRMHRLPRFVERNLK